MSSSLLFDEAKRPEMMERCRREVAERCGREGGREGRWSDAGQEGCEATGAVVRGGDGSAGRLDWGE